MDAVIIGNSRAAVEAIRSFRQNDQDSQLTVISKEEHPAYCRPLIAEYLSKEKRYEEILHVPPDFYSKNDAILLKGVEVIELNADKKEILTDHNQKYAFDRLLIATGSKPVVPPIPGVEFSGVHTFWTIADAQAIAQQIDYSDSAVVIGAGLVGMSAIHALHHRGLQVSVVEMLDRVLSPCLDPAGSEIIQKRMLNLGIDLYLNKKVTEILDETNSGEVSGIKLNSGMEIPCQIVVVSAGVRPNIDFLRTSALDIDTGILVNENMETSVSGIFAAGDAAQPYDIIHHDNKMIANLPNASEQGRIAGANLAGQNIAYQGGLNMTSMRYFGIPFVSMGILSKSESYHEEVCIFNSEMSIYRKLISSEDKLLGAVLVGDIDQAGIILRLIRNNIPIASPKDLLERNHSFEEFRKNLMQESMEGHIQWKQSIGLSQPWRKDRGRIPVGKEDSE